MYSLKPDFTFADLQDFGRAVYGQPNARHFGVAAMLTQIQRFLMRGLKGIRKEDSGKTVENLLIAMSWFGSLLNQYEVSIDEMIWKRFPYACSYCGAVPCVCKKNKPQERRPVAVDESRRPKMFRQFEEMFEDIYPASGRTLEHAGIHLAEEMGELSEAFLTFRGTHGERDFENILLESADLWSCFFGVFNSLGISAADELTKIFHENCHKCHRAPCACTFTEVMEYPS